MRTPWGNSQHTENIGLGILRVDTASHGGYFVPPKLYDAMPAALKCNVYGQGTWFEEDCEWALVVFAFPDLFDLEHKRAAVQTINMYSDSASQYHGAYCWLHDDPEGQRIGQLAMLCQTLVNGGVIP